MAKNDIQTFNFTKAVSYLGGMWAGISVIFGALIYWVLYRSFWYQFTLKIIKSRKDKASKKIVESEYSLIRRATKYFKINQTLVSSDSDESDQNKSKQELKEIRAKQ